MQNIENNKAPINAMFNHEKPKIKLPIFDSKNDSIFEFELRFKMFQRAHGLSDGEAFDFLIMSLETATFLVAKEMTQFQDMMGSKNLPALINYLKRREIGNKTNLSYQIYLKNIQQRENECLESFVGRINNVYNLAYSSDKNPFREDILKLALLSGLRDREIIKDLLKQNLQTFQESVDYLLTQELATKQYWALDTPSNLDPSYFKEYSRSCANNGNGKYLCSICKQISAPQNYVSVCTGKATRAFEPRNCESPITKTNFPHQVYPPKINYDNMWNSYSKRNVNYY